MLEGFIAFSLVGDCTLMGFSTMAGLEENSHMEDSEFQRDFDLQWPNALKNVDVPGHAKMEQMRSEELMDESQYMNIDTPLVPWDAFLDFNGSLSIRDQQLVMGEDTYSSCDSLFGLEQPPPDLTNCPFPVSSNAISHASLPVKRPPRRFDSEDQRWHATLSRCHAADQSFLYGVLTTKIYCRPSCPSRRPARRHVKFFVYPDAIEAAKQAHFRPCKRCKPDGQGVGSNNLDSVCKSLRMMISHAFSSLEGPKGDLKLEQVAKAAGLSIFHFHRFFKSSTHVTPGDFLTACHSLALQDTLGLETNQHLYGTVDANEVVSQSPKWSARTARKALGGLSPTEYAKGATSANINYSSIDVPSDNLCTAYSKKGAIHSVILGPQSEAQMRLRFPTAIASSRHSQRLQQCVRELDMGGNDRDAELPANILPTLWRIRVWLKLVHDGVLEEDTKL